MNDKIPKIRMTSKNAFVFIITEMTAIVAIKLTPITSRPITRSGIDGPRIIRMTAMAIVIENNMSEVVSIT